MCVGGCTQLKTEPSTLVEEKKRSRVSGALSTESRPTRDPDGPPAWPRGQPRRKEEGAGGAAPPGARASTRKRNRGSFTARDEHSKREWWSCTTGPQASGGAAPPGPRASTRKGGRRKYRSARAAREALTSPARPRPPSPRAGSTWSRGRAPCRNRRSTCTGRTRRPAPRGTPRTPSGC